MNHFVMRSSLLLLLFALPTAVHAQINAFGLESEIAHNSIIISHPVPSDEDPGSVYIYRPAQDGQTWEVVDELMASDAAIEDAFGYRVVANGDHLAIGAPSLGGDGGAVYIFAYDSETTSWSEVAKLSGSVEAPVGGVLAFEGTTLVTGGRTGIDSTGVVSVYMRGEDGFEPAGKLTYENVQSTDLFGASVAIASDGTIFVGAPGANENAGSVYHFASHEGAWHGKPVLDGSDEGVDGRHLGTNLHIFGDSMLMVGAPGIVPNIQPTDTPPPGKLIWTEVGTDSLEVIQVLDADSEGNFDLFGFGVSIHDSTMYVGLTIASQQKGGVWVYQLDMDSRQWAKTGEFHGNDGDISFGLNITYSGNTAVVAAPFANQGKGIVRAVTIDEENGEWMISDALKTGKELVLTSSGSVDCTDGMASQFDCGNIDLLSFMTIEDLGGSTGITTNDIWGWVDPETNREYALIGRSNGTSFVDISDPANPVLKGDLPLTEGAYPSQWRDIKVYANHAFIVADNAGPHGMQIFDLTRLREDSDSMVTYNVDAHYDGVASSHNVVINEDTGFAYVVGASGGGDTCGGGLHMVNIQDPLAPEFVGCFQDTSTGRSGTGYSHDAQCVIYEGPDSEYHGNEICFNSNETALSISDVTDKANPVALSVAEYPNVAYTHQGWLTDDFEYFYINDELDELQGKVVGTRTLIWDITDLDDPQLVTEFMSENLSSDHNLYIQGDLMYQSNYRSGLRIFDISDRANPVEVGFFDTYPVGSDKPGFDGSWSNYPFFPSGSIIVSSIGEGLFIVRKQNIDI